MANDLGFTCSCCGERHAELPMGYSTPAPYVWDPSFADAPDCLLSSDQCVIKAQHYFVKGLVEIPVIGTDNVFSWGVWVSLSRENFSARRTSGTRQGANPRNLTSAGSPPTCPSTRPAPST